MCDRFRFLPWLEGRWLRPADGGALRALVRKLVDGDFDSAVALDYVRDGILYLLPLIATLVVGVAACVVGRERCGRVARPRARRTAAVLALVALGVVAALCVFDAFAAVDRLLCDAHADVGAALDALEGVACATGSLPSEATAVRDALGRVPWRVQYYAPASLLPLGAHAVAAGALACRGPLALFGVGQVLAWAVASLGFHTAFVAVQAVDLLDALARNATEVLGPTVCALDGASDDGDTRPLRPCDAYGACVARSDALLVPLLLGYDSLNAFLRADAAFDDLLSVTVTDAQLDVLVAFLSDDAGRALVASLEADGTTLNISSPDLLHLADTYVVPNLGNLTDRPDEVEAWIEAARPQIEALPVVTEADLETIFTDTQPETLDDTSLDALFPFVDLSTLDRRRLAASATCGLADAAALVTELDCALLARPHTHVRTHLTTFQNGLFLYAVGTFVFVVAAFATVVAT